MVGHFGSKKLRWFQNLQDSGRIFGFTFPEGGGWFGHRKRKSLLLALHSTNFQQKIKDPSDKVSSGERI